TLRKKSTTGTNSPAAVVRASSKLSNSSDNRWRWFRAAPNARSRFGLLGGRPAKGTTAKVRSCGYEEIVVRYRGKTGEGREVDGRAGADAIWIVEEKPVGVLVDDLGGIADGHVLMEMRGLKHSKRPKVREIGL